MQRLRISEEEEKLLVAFLVRNNIITAKPDEVPGSIRFQVSPAARGPTLLVGILQQSLT